MAKYTDELRFEVLGDDMLEKDTYDNSEWCEDYCDDYNIRNPICYNPQRKVTLQPPTITNEDYTDNKFLKYKLREFIEHKLKEKEPMVRRQLSTKKLVDNFMRNVHADKKNYKFKAKNKKISIKYREKEVFDGYMLTFFLIGIIPFIGSFFGLTASIVTLIITAIITAPLFIWCDLKEKVLYVAMYLIAFLSLNFYIYNSYDAHLHKNEKHNERIEEIMKNIPEKIYKF